jgi:hypothetical protein
MEQLFGAIPAVLSGLGANEGVKEAVVFAAWQRSAGELLRERTAPIEFYENRLVVAVTDETWQRHLEDLSPRMLVTLNSSLGQGTVNYIEFRIQKKLVSDHRNSNKKTLSPEDRPMKISTSLKAAAEAIADESLRVQFLRAADTYLARQSETDC